MKNKKLLALLAVFSLAIVFFLATHFYQKAQVKKISFLKAQNSELFVPDYAPIYGDKDAPHCLVEFLDPECEVCSSIFLYTKRLIDKYEGKVQLVVRYAPFHTNSQYVVKILEAARKQNKYWEALEILFNYLPQWGNHHDPRPDLIWTYLPKVGIDIEKIKQEMEDPQIVKNMEQDIRDGKILDISGTPSFFLNGKYLEITSFESLGEQVEQELSKK